MEDCPAGWAWAESAARKSITARSDLRSFVLIDFIVSFDADQNDDFFASLRVGLNGENNPAIVATRTRAQGKQLAAEFVRPQARGEDVLLHLPQRVLDVRLQSRISLGEFPKGAAELRCEDDRPHSSAGARSEARKSAITSSAA